MKYFEKIITGVALSSIIIISTISSPIKAEFLENEVILTEVIDGVQYSIQVNSTDESYEVIVPEGYVEAHLEEYGFDNIEQYNSEKNSTQRAFTVAGVIGATSTACYVIQAISGFDPCAWAIRMLWNGMKTPPQTGKWSISRQYVPGPVPGCQPMHSQACARGYWQYTSRKIG